MPEQELDPDVLAQTRREIGRLMAEVEQLASQEITPAEFAPEFLRRAQAALAAKAAAMWLRTPNGNLILQSHINLHTVGLDGNEMARPAHDELLRGAVSRGRPMLVAPNSGPGDIAEAEQLKNPLPYLLVLAPIMLDSDVVGIVEIFQEGARRGSAQQGYLGFVNRLAVEASKFFRNVQYRRILSQQQRWNQFDNYICLVHGGLNPKQVSYLIANEGKKLFECERLSVAIRRGTKTEIEAISGQDIVEKRSNLVQRMAKLADAVLRHGENMIYHGKIEETWPKDVAAALESYLEESGSKLVAVIPMLDQREFGAKGKPPACALFIEMIEDSNEPQELGSRTEIVVRHGASALYNAMDHSQVFLLPFWKALGKWSQWARGSGGAKVSLFTGLAVVATLILVFVPYPLRMEGKGELVPETTRMIYAPVAGVVRTVKVDHGDETTPGYLVAEMSNPQLEREANKLKGELQAATQQSRALEQQKRSKANASDKDLDSKITEQNQLRQGLQQQIELLNRQIHDLSVFSPIRGRVMDWKPKEKLLLRPVKQGDPLLEIADTAGRWILEVQFPESAVTHVAGARQKSPDGRLPVTFVLSASPDKQYHGTLFEVATHAKAVEQENFVDAKIELDPDEDLEKIIKAGDMVAGVEVRAKVDCGPHAIGYVLFHQIIDFVREYVFF